MLFLYLLSMKYIITVTVVIILTWLIKFRLWFFLGVFLLIHICSTSLPKKTKTKNIFWGITMEIKPHSFFVLSLPLHLIHYSAVFWLWIYLKKLCKLFVLWVHFCDGERYLYLLTYFLTFNWERLWEMRGLKIEWLWSILLLRM